ncbi:MAG: acetyltransferase [Ignavibacteriae bacterium]|nr:acetyltransferase [Ignavibacteriota bacterium]
MNNKFFIYGASGHGKVIVDILVKRKEKIIAFIDDDKTKWDTEFFGYKIIGGFDKLINLYKTGDKVILAIGDNKTRKKIAEKLNEKDLSFGIATHPFAQIGRNVFIGEGTVIMANVAVNSDTVIGMHCILNTSSSIDHDNNIGNYVHISPGANLGGIVNVGDLTWIGIGASVKNGINIGRNSIIGAGSIIIKDIKDNNVFVGNPAKLLKKNKN